MGCRKKET